MCVKAIKFLTNILRRLPNDSEQDPMGFTLFLSTMEKLVAKYTCCGDSLANKNTHLTYLAFKLLTAFLKTFPEAAADLSTQLLHNLGTQLRTFKGAAHHKRMFSIAEKLAGHLEANQRSALYKFSIDIARDFKPSCYSTQIFKIIFDQPLAFLDQIMCFFRDIQHTQQELPYLGKLLYQLTKLEDTAQKYYPEYLTAFFDRMLSSPFFSWTNIRFILVFIANFKFIWQGLQFNTGFVKSILRAVTLNPDFLNLIRENVDNFERFLTLQEMLQNPDYLNDTTLVTNITEVVSQQLASKRIENEQLGFWRLRSALAAAEDENRNIPVNPNEELALD